jgi:hypothetical protein
MARIAYRTTVSPRRDFPPVCVMTGTRENVLFCPIKLEHHAGSNTTISLHTELPFTQHAFIELEQTRSRLAFLKVVVAVAFFAGLFFAYALHSGAATVATFCAAGLCFGVLAFLDDRRAQPRLAAAPRDDVIEIDIPSEDAAQKIKRALSDQRRPGQAPLEERLARQRKPTKR